MQMFFKTRTQARAMATNGRKVVDNGAQAEKRWAVKLNKKEDK
ncbi:hypothetical protein QE332_gp073 [Pseudomonas phage vB_PaeM_LCK69]|uniref:Uncharacterized protein n=1 Tax=Pseudomonas phage vB_PaeM_LCK69 TaxID=2488595 RepID=A0A3G8F5G4_9CAUD|nr:hypothetical protein QE332_gp073 [Pseudomonas phage vB_PaeM_LCK69]AZF89684.1 hypothetical protein [Pseudomonas phage vB_PaeM_LCK69]